MEDEYFAGKIKGSVQWIGGVSFFLGFGAEGAAWERRGLVTERGTAGPLRQLRALRQAMYRLKAL